MQTATKPVVEQCTAACAGVAVVIEHQSGVSTNHRDLPHLASVREAAPLVVDLDGTLTLTDTLIESIVFMVKRRPFSLFLIFFWLLMGRARFKEIVARNAAFTVGNLPLREDFLAWVRLERKSGRQIVLATAAHESIANAIAKRLEVFDCVLSTSGQENLKGLTKLAAIYKSVGPRFVYAGDSSSDLPIWHAAEAAVLVGVTATTKTSVLATTKIEKEFTNEPAGLRAWLKALRIHQWSKNLLLFVPLFTAFEFGDSVKLLSAMRPLCLFRLRRRPPTCLTTYGT